MEGTEAGSGGHEDRQEPSCRARDSRPEPLYQLLLDYFEQETDLRRLVSMADAERALDRFIAGNERPLLRGAGRVSKEAADEHCHSQYVIFDTRRKQQRLQHDDGD